jgi:hypothetical protein
LRDAIKDEYLRSWPEFHAVAIDWLEKKIDGRTIRDHLIEAKSKNNCFPQKVWEALPKGKWHLELFGLEDDCNYPVPVTWMLEKGIIKKWAAESYTIFVRPGVSLKINPAEQRKKFLMSRLVDIHPLNKHRVEFVSKMLSFPEVGESYGYHMENRHSAAFGRTGGLCHDAKDLRRAV